MPVTLAEIAGTSGFSSADVAFLAGLEESTVSRLWNSEDWLDRVKGKTLQSLVSTLPGVAEQLVKESLRRRRKQLMQALAEVGLQVDVQAFRALVKAEKIPEQLLANALSAVLHVIRGDAHETARSLARFWGRSQDQAFGCLWHDGGSGGIFSDPSPLIERAFELVARFSESAYSYHSMLGHATLAHHISKATGRWVPAPSPGKLNRRTVMLFRSTTMGQIIQTGDLDEVQRYQQVVCENALLSMVERWSFPTYNRDAVVTTDFSLPGSVLLRNTARELLMDLTTENEAYFFYLVSIAVPFMIRTDPTLGLQAPQVSKAVHERMGTISAVVVRKAAAGLLKSLPEPA